MNLQQLQQTVFHVEPLKNIVGVGDTAAYQIILSPGLTLGTFGVVSVPAHAVICNDPVFSRNSASVTGTGPVASLFRRALATFKV